MKTEPCRDTATRTLAKYGYSDDQIERLFAFHRAGNKLRAFAFPWIEAEEYLKSQGRNVINLVGYGSLLNPVSAARSIRDTPTEGHPAIVALGARRVFNYQMPASVFLRYGTEPGIKDRAALNAESSEFGLMNGRLINLKAEDLPALRIREKAYDLHPVSCVYWANREEPPFSGYVLCCRHEYFEGERFVDDSLSPYAPYANLCREGARRVSEEFLDMYLETSFLADRVTTAREWEEKLSKS